jgi:uncharacterized membrane protein YbaN (DUF454 family)
MNARIKGLLIWWLGWGFVVLGILGLVLPVLQGILFLLIGLSLLSQQSPWAARILHRLRERFPAVAQKYSEGIAKAKEFQMNLFKKKPKQPEEAD